VSATPAYLATVVAHYRHPLNQRSLSAPTHAHEGLNALCGDRVRIELVVRDGRVGDAAFVASACAIATAAASLLTERVRGASLDDLSRLTDDVVLAELGDGLPAARHGCATLAIEVLRQALAGAA
jgi:nitrogen fixation NifU-like protein